MSESRYFTVSCPRCGWIGSSEHAEGGHPIADAGDFSELLCPQCLVCEGISTELVNVEEGGSVMSSDINITEARELFKRTTQGDYISRHCGSEHYSDEEFATEIGDGVQIEGTAICVAWCERNDAEFFAYAHNNWQTIFDTIERQAKEIKELAAEAKSTIEVIDGDVNELNVVVEKRIPLDSMVSEAFAQKDNTIERQRAELGEYWRAACAVESDDDAVSAKGLADLHDIRTGNNYLQVGPSIAEMLVNQRDDAMKEVERLKTVLEMCLENCGKDIDVKGMRQRLCDALKGGV